MAHKSYQEGLILKRIKKGVKYTKLGYNYYHNRHSPLGDRVNPNQVQAIHRLLEKGVVEFIGNTLKIKDGSQIIE